ncbi:hypothetical protein RBH29_09135 [Herbivorax sp. ANBcel31]|nr:hypothetical protein [Herbivorax sp. ANBcel31]MDQ2086585.1 hypothetical protein [Herbivorax sp. ANBcel31]
MNAKITAIKEWEYPLCFESNRDIKYRPNNTSGVFWYKNPVIINADEINMIVTFFIILKTFDEILLRLSPPKIISEINKYMYSLSLRSIAPMIPNNAKVKFTKVFIYFSFIGLNVLDIVDLPVSMSHIREPANAKAYGSSFSAPVILFVIGKLLAAARPIKA